MTPRLQLCVQCKQYLDPEAFTPSVRHRRGYRCQPCQKIANSKRATTVPGRRKLTYAEKAAERARTALSDEGRPIGPTDSAEALKSPAEGFSPEE